MDPGLRMLLRSARMGAAGLVVLALRYGLPLRSAVVDVVTGIVAACFLLSVILPDRSGRSFPDRIGEDRWISLFSFLFLASVGVCIALGLCGGRSPSRALSLGMAIVGGYVAIVSAKVVTARLGSWLTSSVRPLLIPPATFLFVILAGTLMLMMPQSTRAHVPPLNAAFTATSATCVTGLIVQDTGQDFTGLGQAAILLLIQVGGLGLMTFVALFALFLGHTVGLRESLSLSMVMDSEFVADLKRTLSHIVFWTLSIEAGGALLLYMIWHPLGMQSSSLQTVWHAVFHSVSAFCNAGFSLNATNMEAFSSSPATCAIMGSLIVLGGLGFSVLAGLSTAFIGRLRRERSGFRSVHARLVLIVTAVLLGATMILFLACEWNNTLGGMPTGDKLANTFLESVTPRTAGFNTVPTAELSPAVRWGFTALMFVGASPGGTGGGVKTTTVALLLLTAAAMIRGRSTVDLWGRRIAPLDIMRAASVLVLACLVFAGSFLALLVTERGDQGYPDGLAPSDYMFESMSAFGTVGLSTGVTGTLTPTGRIAIMLTMFLGRIGPLMLAVASGRFLAVRYTYPQARVTIG
ncbi:hypothetical protein JW921_04300 [Candidatus Fermentibacterales bacterium]|nr:hypothetical protein [Candidatus Fermentibacterales bacterium]